MPDDKEKLCLVNQSMLIFVQMEKTTGTSAGDTPQVMWWRHNPGLPDGPSCKVCQPLFRFFD